MTRLLQLLTAINNATPARLRLVYLPGKIILWNLRNLKIKTWTLSGPELSTGQPLVILYAGNESQ